MYAIFENLHHQQFVSIKLLNIVQVKMEKSAKQLKNREKILHKFLENPNMSYSMIAKATGMAKSTVGSVLLRYNNTLSIEQGKGRKAEK